MNTLNVIYIDEDILVAYKPEGISSQAERGGAMDMVCLIKNYLSSKNRKYEDVYVIHRLDKPVAGLLVYALNKRAAAKLSMDVQNRRIEKRYYALLCGLPAGYDKEGYNNWQKLRNIIVGAGEKNTYKVFKEEDKIKLSDKEVKDAKEAVLNYRIIKDVEVDGKKHYLADIELITGRYHQIRLQMSGAGAPLFGDLKYNEEAKQNRERRGVALCAYKLEFAHPTNNKLMKFEIKPSNSVFSRI